MDEPKYTVTSNALTAAANATAPRVFDLVVPEKHNSQCCIGLVVVAARCRVPSTQSGSS